jgi:DNA-directed RNA polymerase specialized sigma24 family protein
MSSIGSVTAWINLLCAGDRAAVQPLWQKYLQRLIALAKQKLRSAPRGLADEEDIVLSAFDSFCRGAENGRFPQLNDRDDLWRLLLVITERKVNHLVKHETRTRRGGGRVLSLDALRGRDPEPDQTADSEPTPEVAAEVADEFRHLLAVLGDETLRTVAVAKMEGFKNREIAEQVKLSVPTIERKLKRIRLIWKKEINR